jgi:hypothetical protein
LIIQFPDLNVVQRVEKQLSPAFSFIVTTRSSVVIVVAQRPLRRRGTSNIALTFLKGDIFFD